ncbi:unnamed protein product [Caenorhabditis bovis]|uniref:DUF4140 domain-containing protein n=1 Tax=Caenorhabditis bovis TaxID=2654633 RepID=A0A8S1EVD1_9PELO|nr:unnamed protein product [Caenorhabditis bovis]
MAHEPAHPHVFEASDLATKSVIVYCDRAEVKRLVQVELTKGNHEIVVQNVSAVIERESVRVDGLGVLIQEVQYQEMPHDLSTETDKIIELEKTKADLECEKCTIEDECCSIRKRIEVLDGIASQVSSSSPGVSFAAQKPLLTQNSSQPNLARRHTVTGQEPNILGLGNPGGPPSFLLNEESLENLAKFLQYYGNAVSEMKRELRKRQRNTEQLTERIDLLDRQLDQLRCGAEYDSVKRSDKTHLYKYSTRIFPVGMTQIT